MRLPRLSPAFLPPPSELAWYAILRSIRRWARDLPEEELLKRIERLSATVASVCGRSPAPFVAMGRGLAQTVYCRLHRVRILDRLEPASLVRWEKFQKEAARLPRAVFVSAHLGPFQLQMDLLAELPQQLFFLYRSYRWAPLAREMEALRLKAARFRYVDVRRPREIAKELLNGHSPAFLGDLDTTHFPVRLAIRLNLPLFVGGLYNLPRPSAKSFFGLDYDRIEPNGLETTGRVYAAAMNRLIRNNLRDWVHFER